MTTPTGQHNHGPTAHLVGTPTGLTARTVQRTRRDTAGTHRIVLQRGKRLRVEQVDLLPSTPPAPEALAAILDLGPQGDRSFILNASTRTWARVKARFGDHAWPRAVDLVRAGAITLRCEVADDLSLGAPTRWYLTPAARSQARLHQDERDLNHQRLAHRLRRALDDIEGLDRESDGVDSDDLARLREALARELDRSAPAPKRTAILSALASDLREGALHPSPRAFSLAHTRDSKTWDDAILILRESGVPSALAEAVGLRGHSRIGVGGPISASTRGRTSPLDNLGVVLLPAATADLRLQLRSTTLILVENLQAAESLYQALATGPRPPGIVYHAGMPSHEILNHIAGLAEQADRIVIAPDADLGGTRIATAIWNVLAPAAQLRSMICDIGLGAAHTPQEPWLPDSPVWADLRTMLSSPAASLAQGCLQRGYPVEQEGRIVQAVIDCLD